MQLRPDLSLGTFCLISVLSFYSVLGFPGRDREIHHHGHKQQQAVSCAPDDRYHKETGKCYPLTLYDQGPCGFNMTFVEERKHPDHGICQCTNRIGCQYWPFAFWENGCYPLFQQGPCQGDEWFVEHHNHERDDRLINRGVCKSRLCPRDSLENPVTFLHRGKCHQVNTQGFCKKSEGKMYFFGGPSPQPRCSHQPEQIIGCSNNPSQPSIRPPGIIQDEILSDIYIRSGNGNPSEPSLIIIKPSTSSRPQLVLINLSTTSPTPLNNPDTFNEPSGVKTKVLAPNTIKCPPNTINKGGNCEPIISFDK